MTRDYRHGYESARQDAICALMRERQATTNQDARQSLSRLLVALTGLEPPQDTAAVLGAEEDTDAR
jgi:hypothetical protein